MIKRQYFFGTTLLLFFMAAIFFGCSRQDFDAWKARRLARASKKSYAAATRLYQRLIENASREDEKDRWRFELGKFFLSEGDYAGAIEQLRPVSSPQAQSLLAETLFKNSDFSEALEVFNKTGEEGSPEYLYFYGLTLEKNNLYDQAGRIYALVEKDPVFGPKVRARLQAINLSAPQAPFEGIEENVKEVIQESPGLEKYPDASALYLLVDEDITLTGDNKLVSEAHLVIKVLNDRGKEAFGEVSLGYEATYEKLELVYARTIKPDGTVVSVGDKNIRDVSLYLNYPLYSNARARIISMPELAPGAVIEYKIRITQSRLPNKKDFDSTYWLQMGEPVLWQKCRITVPKERTLRYKIINPEYNTFGFDMAPKVHEEDGKKVFTLEFRDVPQIIPEVAMPSGAHVNTYILFSTFQSWQDIYTWWQGLYKDKAAADEAIRAKVAELTKDKESREEKIRAIYDFCVQDIRYVAVEYGDAGYEPHKASEIFANKYGDCKDKAILLISMLGVAGIEAYPVLISTEDSLDLQKDLPSLRFNHAIAAVMREDKIVFMDGTASTVPFSDLPPGDQDRETLVFFKDAYKIVRTPLFGPMHNRIATRMTVKINDDESIEAERRVDAKGSYLQAQRYWLKYTMPILIEEGLKQKARSIADNATLTEHEVKNVDDLNKPVLLRYRFSAPRYFIKAGTSRIMDQMSSVDTTLVFKEKRRYPIEMPGPDFQEDTIDIELPGHLAVKYLPAPVELTTRWFRFISRYEVLDSRHLRYTYARETKAKRISVQEYGGFKKAIEDLAEKVNQHLVLEERQE